MSVFRRAGLIPERIWPLQLGAWSFKWGDSGSRTITRSRGAIGLRESAQDHLPLRLLLLGVAVGIQAYHEIPPELTDALFGLTGANLVSFFMMALSLVSICLAISPHVPRWLDGKIGLALGRIAFFACLALAVLGVRQVVVMVEMSFQAPVYYNDGTLLDHNAAALLLRGQNPYTQSDIVSAIRDFHQPAKFTTPLQQGKLLHQQDYPTPDQLSALLAQEPAGHPAQVLEFESHVSYPALAFLTLVPLVWAGAPTMLPFYLLCLTLLAVIGLRFVRRDLRWWLALLFLADIPVLNSVMAGDLDVLYILLVFLAWLTWRRWWVSAMLMGLALASKQIAWFYLPFYFIFVYQRRGFRDAAARLGLAALLFLAINVPFILMNSTAWITGVLAPMRDPMFPEGAGLVALSVGKLVPFLPQGAYTVLEGLGMVGVLLWYFKWGRQRPEAALVLAIVPLFLAWRSLPTYFYFCILPTALLLAVARGPNAQETGGTREVMPDFEAEPVQLAV